MTINKDAVVTIDYEIKDSEGKLLESADGELMSYIQGMGSLDGKEEPEHGHVHGEHGHHF